MIDAAEEIDRHGKMMKKFPDKEHPDEPNMIAVNPGETRNWYDVSLRPA